jgi:acyl-CoA synthetase (AMP-forming)/AMP-acid ligase II
VERSGLELDPEVLFRDPVTLSARRELARRWRRAGFAPGHGVGEQAFRAAAAAPETQLVFTSPERPSRLRLEDLWSRACSVAAGFQRRGVRAGDVVAVQLPNWSEALVAYVAAATCGAVVLPIVHTYGVADTDWILERVRPRLFILPERWGGNDYLERLEAMHATRDVEHVVVVGGATPSGTERWAALEAADASDARIAAVNSADPFLLTFTSGTTAEPKGVVHSHDSFLAELQSMPSPSRRFDRVATLQPWPAGHIGGMTAILGPLVHGLDTFLIDRWDTESVVELVAREGIVAASGVPTALLRVMDLLEATGRNLPLRELSTGGAGIPPSVVERGARLGWHIGRCYGSSEHPSATYCRHDDTIEHRLHADGVPMAGTEVRTVRDDGSKCDVGEPGEIALIGPEQFLGYTDPALNAELIDREGWFLTGDVGVLDADGFLTVTDRKKDLVIRGGENISSVEVEDILLRHPAVVEAAVVASPDPEYGERVCAFVVLQPGASLSLEDVQAHFAGRGVQRQKTPELLLPVTDDELPRTAAGKVRKAELRDRLRATAPAGKESS